MALDPDEGRLDYFIPRLVGLQVQYETFFFFPPLRPKQIIGASGGWMCVGLCGASIGVSWWRKGVW
jgi:hypothetical protein